MSKYKTVCASMLTCIMTAVCLITPVFASSGGDISGAIKGGLGQVYGILSAIVLPIGAIAAAICGIKMIWGDQRAAETAKSTLIKIIIGLALVMAAPFLIKTISTWFSGVDNSGVF